MKNPHRALEAIEVLVGNDFGMDMEWLLHDKRKKKIDPRLLEAAEVITQIYRIAHAEGSCYHEDWAKEKYKILEAYNKGFLPKPKRVKK